MNIETSSSSSSSSIELCVREWMQKWILIYNTITDSPRLRHTNIAQLQLHDFDISRAHNFDRPLPAPVISATFPAKLRRPAIILDEKFYPKATQLVGKIALNSDLESSTLLYVVNFKLIAGLRSQFCRPLTDHHLWGHISEKIHRPTRLRPQRFVFAFFVELKLTEVGIDEL